MSADLRPTRDEPAENAPALATSPGSGAWSHKVQTFLFVGLVMPIVIVLLLAVITAVLLLAGRL